jgi:hypothetical protein
LPRALVEIRVALERDADQIGDEILGGLGQVLGARRPAIDEEDPITGRGHI